jgi:hypothetical protein
MKLKNIKLVFVASPQRHAALRRKSKDWLARNRNNVCGATYISADCCFSELTNYKNRTPRVGLVQSGPHHHLIENLLVLAMM